MSEDRRSRLRTAEFGAGATMLAAGTSLPTVQRGWNGARARRYNYQIADRQIQLDHLAEQKRQRVADYASGRPQPPHDKDALKATKRRLHGEIGDLNAARNSRKGKMLMARHVRVMVGMPIAGGLVAWHGARGMVDKKLDRRDIDAGSLGAAAGAAGYQGSSLLLKPVDRRAERRIAEDRELKAKVNAYARTPAMHHSHDNYAEWRDYFRRYPKDLPGARVKRTLGRTHSGKSGAAMTVGTSTLAALEGIHLSRRNHPHNPTTFGKRLVEQERRLSPVRAAEAGVGVAGLAWGVPRVRMIGPALRMGSRTAQSPYVRQALHQTERGRVYLEAASAGPGRRVASSGFGTRLGGLVPPRLQGEVVAGAGALLLSHALPIHNTTAVAVQGW